MTWKWTAKGAIDLITRSAEDGLPEAMEKLADMYSGGTTVERDCRAAAHWQSRLTQFRQTRFAKSRSEQDGMALMTALFRLGHFQHMSNNPCMVKAVSGLSEYDLSGTGWKEADLAGAEKSFLQVIEVSGQLYDLYNIQKAREFSLLSFLELGDICQHGGRPDRARDYYLQAGNLCQEVGRLDEAREYHLGEIELFTWLCTQSWSPWSKPADAWWHWRWLYGICRDLGNDSLKTGRLEEALDYYQRSMEASQRAYRISATKESTEEYFTACVQMVQSLTQSGGLRRAGEYVEKAFEACEKRPADMSGDQSMWKDLISAFENLRRNGVIPMAETKDQGLKELGLRFTKEVSPKEKQELAGSCEQLGAVSRAQGDLLLTCLSRYGKPPNPRRPEGT